MKFKPRISKFMLIFWGFLLLINIYLVASNILDDRVSWLTFFSPSIFVFGLGSVIFMQATGSYTFTEDALVCKSMGITQKIPYTEIKSATRQKGHFWDIELDRCKKGPSSIAVKNADGFLAELEKRMAGVKEESLHVF